MIHAKLGVMSRLSDLSAQMAKVLIWLVGLGCGTNGSLPNIASEATEVRDDKLHGYRPLVLIYWMPSSEEPAVNMNEGTPGGISTGIIIGPHHVLTAAHNLHDDSNPHIPLEDRLSQYAIALDPGVDSLNNRPYYDFTKGSQYSIAYVMSNRSPKESTETLYMDNDLAVLVTAGTTEFPAERFAHLPSLKNYNWGLNAHGYNCNNLLVGYGAPDGQRRAASMCVLQFDQTELTSQLPAENAHWVLDYQPLHYVHRSSSRIRSEDRMNLGYAGTGCFGDSGAPLLDYAQRVVGVHKGGVPLTEDGTEQLCLDSPAIVYQGANLMKYWGWVDRIRRLCSPQVTKSQCMDATLARTCGNLASERGYEQTDVKCYQRRAFETDLQAYTADPLAPTVQKAFEQFSRNADLASYTEWPADWSILDSGEYQTECDLCVAHDWH